MSASAALAARLAAAARSLDHTAVQRRFDGVPVAGARAAPSRSPVRLGGEVRSLDVGRRGGVGVLDVVLADGEGEIVARFTGRRSLSGVEPGRAMVVEGVGRPEAGRLVILNPAYALAPLDAEDPAG